MQWFRNLDMPAMNCEKLFYFVALKIHVSPSTKLLLDKFGTFELKLRGDVEMKV